MIILIGSKAAGRHYADWRVGNDTDYLVTRQSEMDDWFRLPKTEYHFEPEFETYEMLLQRHTRIYLDELTGEVEFVADKNFLYTLKVSHSFWDVHWAKTIHDIRDLKSRGCEVVPELFQVFYNVWCRVHGPKIVNLNVPNEQFFTHYVDRQIDHDRLHEIFKYGDKPKYQILKKDPTKALISKSMFFAQSYEDQLNTVREEMLVLASERFLIPGLCPSPGAAVRRALKVLVTSASKGWFPLFIVDNYSQVLEAKLPQPLFRIKEIINERKTTVLC